MSNPFIFVDSCPAQPQKGDLRGLFLAVDKLNTATRDSKMQLLSVSGKRRVYEPQRPEIITYTVTEQLSKSVLSASFDISHYIGSYSTRINNGIVSIEIKPRWGEKILEYLLQYTTGIYLPPNAISGIKRLSVAEWILALLWRSVFNQALRRFHIPKEYRTKLTNDRVFKGRLDVLRQIRESFADQSKFCCVHRPLTIDTTINQTIRCVFRLLTRNRAGAMLSNGFESYDEMLAGFGVKLRDVRPEEIDRIRYTSMSHGYQPLMQVGKAIIRQLGASRSDLPSGEFSFFIDVSEIWENYIEAILVRHLPSTYRIVNPNETGGQWLFVGQKREIRPDLIIENEAGVPVAILDAKFKPYNKVGDYESGGVGRDDLYQMITYMYHYGKDRNTPLLGLFISPVKGLGDRENLRQLDNRRNHEVGVLNLDLEQWNDKEDVDIMNILTNIRTNEKIFADNLQHLLERDCPPSAPLSQRAVFT